MRHTVMHHSSTSMYTPNFIEIWQTFCGRTYGHTYWRTDISPSNVIRSTRRSRPNNGNSCITVHIQAKVVKCDTYITQHSVRLRFLTKMRHINPLLSLQRIPSRNTRSERRLPTMKVESTSDVNVNVSENPSDFGCAKNCRNPTTFGFRFGLHHKPRCKRVQTWLTKDANAWHHHSIQTFHHCWISTYYRQTFTELLDIDLL